MKRFILSLVLFIGINSSLVAESFSRDNAKEVVVDSATNLMWQDNADAKTVIKTWQDAIDYCEALSLGGYADWHLANYNELYSIADRSRYGPAIDPTFQNVVISSYWSSTTGASDTSKAWAVNFNYGYDGWGGKTYKAYVRCVRDNN